MTLPHPKMLLTLKMVKSDPKITISLLLPKLESKSLMHTLRDVVQISDTQSRCGNAPTDVEKRVSLRDKKPFKMTLAEF